MSTALLEPGNGSVLSSSVLSSSDEFDLFADLRKELEELSAANREILDELRSDPNVNLDGPRAEAPDRAGEIDPHEGEVPLAEADPVVRTVGKPNEPLEALDAVHDPVLAEESLERRVIGVHRQPDSGLLGHRQRSGRRAVRRAGIARAAAGGGWTAAPARPAL